MKKVYEAPTTEMYALQTEGLIATSTVSQGNEDVIDGWGAMSKKKSR